MTWFKENPCAIQQNLAKMILIHSILTFCKFNKAHVQFFEDYKVEMFIDNRPDLNFCDKTNLA